MGAPAARFVSQGFLPQRAKAPVGDPGAVVSLGYPGVEAGEIGVFRKGNAWGVLGRSAISWVGGNLSKAKGETASLKSED